MQEIYVPLASGLAGAVIGALASIAAMWIQARTQDRRERLRHAADLALEDYKFQLDLATKSGKKVSIPPVVLFLHYHIELMDLMEKGKLTAENLKYLAESNNEIHQVIKDLNK